MHHNGSQATSTRVAAALLWFEVIVTVIDLLIMTAAFARLDFLRLCIHFRVLCWIFVFGFSAGSSFLTVAAHAIVAKHIASVVAVTVAVVVVAVAAATVAMVFSCRTGLVATARLAGR